MKIIKLNNRVWKFVDVEIGEFSPSKFTINRLNNKVTVVYFNNLKSKTYDIADVEIYDIGAVVPFTTTNGDVFMLKLEELNCPCFQKDETTIINPPIDISGKLNKDTTAGVERVWVYGTDGIGFEKPTSELKDVLEFADLASFPLTGETGKIYVALDTNFTYRWSGSAYVKISGGGSNKQIFHWWGGNWNTPTLNRYYYIGYNGGAIEHVPSATDITTITESMTGRNKGLFIAPFDCKIKRVIFKEGGSGSYTGAFVLASGSPNYNGTWNIGYANIVTHINSAISASGFEQHKNEYTVTDNITVPKGYVISPMLRFSAQGQAGKNAIEISVEIEEVI